MTAKRHLRLQIVISLSSFFIFILEALNVAKRTLSQVVGSGLGAFAMLSCSNRNLITLLFTLDWLLIAYRL